MTDRDKINNWEISLLKWHGPLRFGYTGSHSYSTPALSMKISLLLIIIEILKTVIHTKQDNFSAQKIMRCSGSYKSSQQIMSG